MPDMESLRETVYPAEWPGFPGETEAREHARADLRVVDELSQKPSEPDWLTMTAAFKTEEAATFKEADKSPIYDYEIEIQRPVQPLAKQASRPNWRQRAKSLMGRASEALRDSSIAVFTTAQVKSEDLKNYYGDEESGKKRRRVTAVVAGALALGTAVYLNSKGASPGSSHRHATEAASTKPVKQPHITVPHQAIHAVETPHKLTVHNGQNPWTISEQHLRAQGISHPSVDQIADYDRKMAKANPDVYTYGDDSAEYIQAGTKLQLP